MLRLLVGQIRLLMPGDMSVRSSAPPIAPVRQEPQVQQGRQAQAAAPPPTTPAQIRQAAADRSTAQEAVRDIASISAAVVGRDQLTFAVPGQREPISMAAALDKMRGLEANMTARPPVPLSQNDLKFLTDASQTLKSALRQEHRSEINESTRVSTNARGETNANLGIGERIRLSFTSLFSGNKSMSELVATRQGLQEQMAAASPAQREILQAKIERVTASLGNKEAKALADPAKAQEYAGQATTPPNVLTAIARQSGDIPTMRSTLLANPSTPRAALEAIVAANRDLTPEQSRTLTAQVLQHPNVSQPMLDRYANSADPELKALARAHPTRTAAPINLANVRLQDIEHMTPMQQVNLARTPATRDNARAFSPIMERLAQSPDPNVRFAAMTNYSFWGKFSEGQFQAGQATDGDANRILKNVHQDPDPDVRSALLANSRVTQRQVVALANDGEGSVNEGARRKLEADGYRADFPANLQAGNEQLSGWQTELTALSQKPDLTDADRARLREIKGELATTNTQMLQDLAEKRRYCSGEPDDDRANRTELEGHNTTVSRLNELITSTLDADMDRGIANMPLPAPPPRPPAPPRQ